MEFGLYSPKSNRREHLLSVCRRRYSHFAENVRISVVFVVTVTKTDSCSSKAVSVSVVAAERNTDSELDAGVIRYYRHRTNSTRFADDRLYGRAAGKGRSGIIAHGSDECSADALI